MATRRDFLQTAGVIGAGLIAGELVAGNMVDATSAAPSIVMMDGMDARISARRKGLGVDQRDKDERWLSLGGWSPRPRRYFCGASAQERRDSDRKNECSGIWPGITKLQPGFWCDAQRLRAVEDIGRQQRRSGGVAGAAHVARSGR